ncbi:hypothetical protein [Klebsiella sp. FR21TRMT6331]|uniref:hypothetical protein n=1 Tax=Klebsiella sp. FR21TRMT6331 TaxID=3381299 RepID=UPI003A97ED03
MKTTLQKVRDSITAALQGRTVEEMEDAQRQEAVCAAVGRFLDSNPDWKPSQQSSQQPAPVKDSNPATQGGVSGESTNGGSPRCTKQKAKRILKTLGQNGFTPHVIDEVALARARAKCREIVAADPSVYSFIIESAPIKGTND